MPKSDARMLAEFCVPAASVGAIAAVFAGGLAPFAGLSAGWAVVVGLALGVPVALVGSAYAILLAKEKVSGHVFLPMALIWLVGYPLCRLIHQVVFEYAAVGSWGLSGSVWEFFAFQAMLSMGFAFGFMWAHEQFGRRWWPKIREHNVYAHRTVEDYKGMATALQYRKEAAEDGRTQRRKQRAKAKAGKA